MGTIKLIFKKTQKDELLKSLKFGILSKTLKKTNQ